MTSPADPHALPVVCCVCQRHLRGPDPAGRPDVSHGLCADCWPGQLAALGLDPTLPYTQPKETQP